VKSFQLRCKFAEKLPQPFGTPVHATSLGVARFALVLADEDVMFESGHADFPPQTLPKKYSIGVSLTTMTNPWQEFSNPEPGVLSASAQGELSCRRAL